MYEFCKWYSLIMIIIGALAVALRTKSTTTEYTTVYKLMSIIFNFPIWYFVIATVSRG